MCMHNTNENFLKITKNHKFKIFIKVNIIKIKFFFLILFLQYFNIKYFKN